LEKKLVTFRAARAEIGVTRLPCMSANSDAGNEIIDVFPNPSNPRACRAYRSLVDSITDSCAESSGLPNSHSVSLVLVQARLVYVPPGHAEQLRHTVLLVVVHACEMYVPLGHVEQTLQMPSLVGPQLVKYSSTAHDDRHVAHTVLRVREHTLLLNSPAPHTVQLLHAEFCCCVHAWDSYWLLPQLVQLAHCVSVVLVQFATTYCPREQAEQTRHTVFDVAVHAVSWYSVVAAQAEHDSQIASAADEHGLERYSPLTQVRQAVQVVF
jgi:hypothetical protein